jgi:UDP:flavonoid glycosyltransferase YjiC (YdhE family)
MRLLAACSLGGAGHLGPLRPFLDAARRAGHETMVVAPPAMAAMVEATGHPFRAGGQPPEDAIALIRERLPVVSAEEGSILGNRDLFGRLATAAMLPALTAAVDAWRPDAILREPCEYASAIVAAARRLPVAQVAISFAEVEWASIGAAAPALEEHRPGLTGIARATPYWTRFPALLDPSPFATTARTRETTPAPRPLPAWWGDDRRRLVYVTFGTVLGHMTAAAEAFAVVLRAVAGLDARVLLTVGRAFAPDRLGPLPDHVHVEQWVDQVDVLAEADAVVCHGGSGTVLGALAMAVPMVVVPRFADQFTNAAKVAGAGAGLVVAHDIGAGVRRRPITADDAPRIAAALGRVLAEGTFRAAAGRLAAAMADAPAPDELLRALTAPTRAQG